MNQPNERLNPTDSLQPREPDMRQRASAFDQVKAAVAEKLHAAADTLHDKSSRRVGRNDHLSGYGHQAAGWLDRSAEYIGEMNLPRVKSDIENQVRHHPGRSLLIAGAAGLILGAMLRRR